MNQSTPTFWDGVRIDSEYTMHNKSNSILILDDDEYVLKSLARFLRTETYSIRCSSDPQEALNLCRAGNFDLILSDQRMPGITGTEFFLKVAQMHPQTRRVLISGYSDFTSVTDAFNAGVIHKFVVKPWNNQQLRELIEEQLKIRNKNDSGHRNPSSTAKAQHSRSPEIITRDPGMLKQLAIIRKTASSEASFFIHGETGSGKELVAHAIHDASNRKAKPFIAVNCANLTETLLESQLFGHRKGAFTGADKDQRGLIAESEGGTLFLDEITEISIGLQAKLLRVLQEREYTPLGETSARPFDVKIISASSTRLKDAVENGRFREDLRYRLEVIPIEVPPLRARGSDRALLFDFFLREQLARNGLPALAVEPAVYECIDQYSWPGNVRELINVCTYVAALTSEDDESIGLANFPFDIRSATRAGTREESSGKPASVQSRQVTREMLEKASIECAGHRDSMAQYLGISRMTLWRRMKSFGLL